MRRGLTPAVMARMVDRFNRRHPVGNTIRVWPGRMLDGPGCLVAIVEPGAYVLGGHTPVVQVTGGHGCIDLRHARSAGKHGQRAAVVKPADDAAPRVPA